jgi:hypothetical protein
VLGTLRARYFHYNDYMILYACNQKSIKATEKKHH